MNEYFTNLKYKIVKINNADMSGGAEVLTNKGLKDKIFILY